MAKKQVEKRRVIVNYLNITQEQLHLLSDAYPFGIDEEDIFRYTNAQGEKVETVPLETKDTKYLFKISTKLEAKLQAFNDEDDEDDDLNIDEISDSDNIGIDEEED